MTHLTNALCSATVTPQPQKTVVGFHTPFVNRRMTSRARNGSGFFMVRRSEPRKRAVPIRGGMNSVRLAAHEFHTSSGRLTPNRSLLMAQKLNTQKPSPIVYQGEAVVTTAMLAEYYSVGIQQLRQNHANNRDRFVEGKHCTTLTNGQLKEFKRGVESFDSVKIARNVNALTLWTRRGAARHAKMLNSDKAWEVFEQLEDSYFSAPVAATPRLALPPLPPRKVAPCDRAAALEHLIRRLRDHHPTVTYAIALDREDIADELERLAPWAEQRGLAVC